MEPTFKIRSSATAKLMGVKGLGQTGFSYLESWLKNHLYKRRADVKSKYLDKGNIAEEDGFTLMALQLDLGMVYKNIGLFQNDYLIGTPDLIVNGVVYDNKCSWSLDTFPMFDKDVPNKDYYWQLQSYMELTGSNKAVLAYTLIDADISLIEQAIKWESDANKIYQIICNMTYTKATFESYAKEFCPTATANYFVEIPDHDRIRTFNIDKDQKAIDLIYTRVKESREYINSLLNK
jgi:hypothetical protein